MKLTVSRLSELLLVVAVVALPMPAAFASGSGTVRIISTNDLHSYLRPVYYRYLDEFRPWGTQSMEGDYVNKAALEGRVGGMAHVSTMINRLRDEASGDAIVVDSGDTWHGAGVSVFDKGENMVKIMNQIGYDAMVPGNWEFIYPRERFEELVDLAEFPVIAYNLTDKEWGDPVLDQYVIKEVGGLKVAIIGLTYPWTALTSSVAGSAQWWKYGIKEAEAEELLEEIRAEEDPDLIVFISHAGYGMDQKFARRIDGIDVMVSGHTHNPVFDPVVWNDTIVYEAGAHGEFVSSLDLEVKDKKIVSYNYRLAKVNQSVAADPDVQKLVDAVYEQHGDKLTEVVGETGDMVYRRDYFQSTMGNLITDALRDIEGTDIGFFPAWRYGATLLPGDITAEDVYNIVPTGGHIFTYTMTGKDLRILLENIFDGVVDYDPFSRVGGDMLRFSGLNVVYDLANASGEKIVSMTTESGESIEDDKEYSVASVHTRFQDSPMFGTRNLVDTEKVFAEELIEYIRKNSPIQAGLDTRITARGAPGSDVQQTASAN